MCGTWMMQSSGFFDNGTFFAFFVRSKMQTRCPRVDKSGFSGEECRSQQGHILVCRLEAWSTCLDRGIGNYACDALTSSLDILICTSMYKSAFFFPFLIFFFNVVFTPLTFYLGQYECHVSLVT